jgi:hypothetical protein
VVKFDEAHEKVVSAKATEYKSEWPVRAASRERDTPIIKRGHQALFLYRCSIHWIHWYRPIAIAHRMMMEVITMLSWNTCDP